ncbi:L-serine ammonia-lyase [Enteractinococcus fodinae]|uniref:L-serine dehydratase n=1 Tax=Enteractinococcus fodinae TaxID=684663 RepID=A0ABU2AYH0_9MICC|nr:L-serine ammonia-lyase [Enteractinococcus fodinae]MDR7346403.1 L-serine dehydratase [Enteractinococcus fodinae]
MALSVLDMFSIGLGPSSSHTVGPMRAAAQFINGLDADTLAATERAQVELFGSLGATGIGHHSDTAVILGLAGHDPATIVPDQVDDIIAQVETSAILELAGRKRVAFDRANDVILHLSKSLPGHPNGMKSSVYDANGTELASQITYSIGGGFVVTEDELDKPLTTERKVRHDYRTGTQLLELCHQEGKSIADLTWENELEWRDAEEIRSELLHIWQVMQDCVQAGIDRTETTLPGGLKVTRRAPRLYKQLSQGGATERTGDTTDALRGIEWVNLYALAVNEENASGGRVVTAPTNGAAGIIPAVLHYYTRFLDDVTDDKIVEFMLTAGAIGIIIKTQASISGAEVGCQGEVGSACSMAAAGLAAVMGGTPSQVEDAAEMALEHNLGMTCDPVGGLVQIPCIERNAIASVKAINAARLALHGDGTHKVSLDQAIETMRATGADMMDKYKETSRGGLAVAVTMPEC